MATYIVLGKLTQAGIGGIKEAPKRRQQGREQGQQLGVSFQVYLTMGAHDLVWVVDAPSDEAVAKWVIGVGRTGNLTTQTMRAFTESEVDALVEGI
jgi:uncharacterized protein with GYD domain